MSFIFQKADGTILKQNDLIEKSSLLLNGAEVEFYIYTDVATTNPGIYLKTSSFLGEINMPAKESIYKDYADLLHWGSDQNIDAGLEVKRTVEGVEEWTKFSFTHGASFSNRISLEQAVMSEAGNFSITLRYKSNPNVEARRLFIGVEIDDSWSTI